MEKKKITKKTTIAEALRINEKAGEILFGEGLACLGCSMILHETIEQGCCAHGMNEKQIDELVEKLNKK